MGELGIGFLKRMGEFGIIVFKRGWGALGMFV
jgi:hypothetical protein